MERLTKLEILNETIAFYNGDVNRRSKTNRGQCVYNGENGTHCAVGRCMLPKFKEQGSELNGNIGTFRGLANFNNLTFDEILEEKYRGHEYHFWTELQELHDRDELWDNAGLNAEGEQLTNKICEIFNLAN